MFPPNLLEFLHTSGKSRARIIEKPQAGFTGRPYKGTLPLNSIWRAYTEAVTEVWRPCAQQPLDDLLGEDLKTINLSAYGAAGGIVASLPDVTR